MKHLPPKILYGLTEAFLSILLILNLTSCEGLFGQPKTNQLVNITNSGLTENKTITGLLEEYPATVTLFAKSGTCTAEIEVSQTSSNARTAFSYNGYFVYNKNSKALNLYFPTTSTKYYKTSVDLSGTSASSSSPAQVEFTVSTQNEFSQAVETVASLSDGTDTNPSGPEGSEEDTNLTPSEKTEKTPSTYTSGRRNIEAGTKANGNGITFKSTVQPAEKPDYSSIDRAMENLTIPTDTSISDAAAMIVSASGARTQKENVRAFYYWIAKNVMYDYESHDDARFKSTGAFTQRKAVCLGFSRLMEDMCEAQGIETKIIYGCGNKGRYSSAKLQMQANFFDDNHAWNLIKPSDGDENFLVDVTWASGETVDDKWFDTDPCYFITSHFPVVESNRNFTAEEAQLITPALTRNEFVTLPRLDAELEKAGIDGKEILEFTLTHLDTWYNCFLIDPSLKTNIYILPLSSELILGKEYEFAYEMGGKYYSQIEKITSENYYNKGESYVFDRGNLRCSYMIEESHGTERSNPSDWYKIYHSENGLVDEVKVKMEATASIDETGVITLNGERIEKTGFVTVIPKGTVAAIDGNFPVAETPHPNSAGVIMTLENDSAFPVGRKVKLSSFEMMKYPITVGLAKKLLGECIDNYPADLYLNRRRYIMTVKERTTRMTGENIAVENLDGEYLVCHYLPYYETEEEYENDYVYMSATMGAYIANALTKLLMSEEDCAYKVVNVEPVVRPHSKGISSEVTEEQIQTVCEKLEIPRENILSMFIAKEEGKILQTEEIDFGTNIGELAQCLPDYSKKGFRIPTDAEWEFAARGGDPSGSEWTVERTRTENYGNENSLKIVDMFTDVWPYKWLPDDDDYFWYYDHSGKDPYSGDNGPQSFEYVMDKLCSNTMYDVAAEQEALFGTVDEDGYILNPMVLTWNCVSGRSGTSSRNQRGRGFTGPDICADVVRLVRSLD